MNKIVECHSGYEYAEHLKTFYWQGQRFEISKITRIWRSPEGKGFEVQTTTQKDFLLFYHGRSMVIKTK